MKLQSKLRDASSVPAVRDAVQAHYNDPVWKNLRAAPDKQGPAEKAASTERKLRLKSKLDERMRQQEQQQQ